MARMRTVKPEFWVDDKIVDLSLLAKLLYIGMWNFADDDGYIEDSARRIKRQVFPDNDYDVATALEELVSAGIVARRSSDQGPLIFIPKFKDHQKPQHPTTTKFTSIQSNYVSPQEDSRNSHEPSPGRVVESSGVESRTSALSADGFDDFYAAFPHKVARGAAVKAYRSALKKTDAQTILEAALVYASTVVGADKKFIAHPATWLNAERWDDDLSPAVDPDAWMRRQ